MDISLGRVSNMRAIDWCVSRVRDIAERFLYRFQGYVRMGKGKWKQLGRIDDFVDQHLQWKKFTFTVVQNLLEEIFIYWIYGYHRGKIKNGYWTS